MLDNRISRNPISISGDIGSNETFNITQVSSATPETCVNRTCETLSSIQIMKCQCVYMTDGLVQMMGVQLMHILM